jgi:T4 superinfection immunity protein
LAFAGGRAIIVAPLQPAGGMGEAMFDSTTTIIMLILVVLIYMLPTLIAFGREHPHRMDVAVLNIIFGWTLIGWFVVFLWAALARPSDQFA